MQCPAVGSLGDLSIPGAGGHSTAQKKSRKQRIPGGRRTQAASGGDWITRFDV